MPYRDIVIENGTLHYDYGEIARMYNCGFIQTHEEADEIMTRYEHDVYDGKIGRFANDSFRWFMCEELLRHIERERIWGFYIGSLQELQAKFPTAIIRCKHPERYQSWVYVQRVNRIFANTWR